MLSVTGQFAAGKAKVYELVGAIILHMTLGIFGVWVLAIAAS
jgi:hypothetical protein